MDWWRAHHGLAMDIKYPVIAERAGQPVERVIALWLALLDHASQQDEDERGSIAGFDVELTAAYLRCPPEALDAILAAMQRPKRDGSPGMLDGDRITAWSRRQPKREDETAAERKRRQRARDQQADTLGHAASRDVTTETETETEKIQTTPHSPPPGALSSSLLDGLVERCGAKVPRQQVEQVLGELAAEAGTVRVERQLKAMQGRAIRRPLAYLVEAVRQDLAERPEAPQASLTEPVELSRLAAGAQMAGGSRQRYDALLERLGRDELIRLTAKLDHGRDTRDLFRAVERAALIAPPSPVVTA